MKSKILIMGGLGMLGHKLWLELSKYHDVWVTLRGGTKDIPNYSKFNKQQVYTGIEVTNYDAVLDCLIDCKPDYVVNCIGLIKQKALAKDPFSAISINALFPHKLARACNLSGAKLIHISTDCVFSGKKGFYCETDLSDAEDLYGKSKFLGEVTSYNAITIRTSIIGRELKGGYGLIEWFLSKTGKINGYDKVMYNGITTGEMARVLLNVIFQNKNLSGLYQVSSNPISKYNLLCKVKEIMNLDVIIERDCKLVSDRTLNSKNFYTRTRYSVSEWDDMLLDLKEHQDLYC